MRHRWFPVEEDMRRDVCMPRPVIHHCRVCGTYRWVHLTRVPKRTYYGVPYEHSVGKAPECRPTRGPHQFMEDAG